MSSPAQLDSRPHRAREKGLPRHPHYVLRCLGTERILDDSLDHRTGNLPLANNDASEPAFLRSEYTNPRLQLLNPELGLFRYASWLPVRRFLSGSSAPITYKSNGLAELLGLDKLYITFSGYWPERNVAMQSGTFKECEAYAVAGRMGDTFPGTLVIASAGNTARAFHRVFEEHQIPVVIVVPEANLHNLWSAAEQGERESAKVIAVTGDADYSDAIALAGRLCEIPGYLPEGGAKNVARRDGMGTTMLSAATTIGRIPDHYFQAVGSGTGAIAAYEANLRLLEDGRYGSSLARLHLSQNAPFTLLYDSWQRRERNLLSLDEEVAKHEIEAIRAKVLANRKPPYSLRGGLFDALLKTDGVMYAPSNEQAATAATIFEETEGIDLEPAAAVAVASLLEAVRSNNVPPTDTVMLNITGGGIERYRRETRTQPIKPDIRADKELTTEELAALLAQL